MVNAAATCGTRHENVFVTFPSYLHFKLWAFFFPLCHVLCIFAPPTYSLTLFVSSTWNRVFVLFSEIVLPLS